MEEMNIEEQRLEDLNQQLSVVQLVKIIGFILLLMTSLGDILTSLSISYYEHLFRDIFHGINLPLCAQLVLRFKAILIALSCFWPLMGIVALFIQNRPHLTLSLLALAQAAALVQTAFTFLALQIPLAQVLSELAPR